MGIVGLLVIIGLLIVFLPVLGAIAVAGAGVLVALFAVGLVLSLVGGTVRFGLGIGQLAIGLAVSIVGLLLLAGTLGVASLFFFKLWPVLLIFIGLFWLLRRR